MFVAFKILSKFYFLACSETNLFECKDKSRCLPVSKVCDGHPDCEDRTDEGGLCSELT